MGFQLEFQGFETADGPLWFAAIPWDSLTFGFAVYQIDAQRSERAIRGRHLRDWQASLCNEQPLLATVKTPSDDGTMKRPLSEAGFYPVETMFDLELDIREGDGVYNLRGRSDSTRPAKPSDRERLMEIAATAFVWDRLHLDGHIPSTAADERMRRWIADGLERSEPILVLEERSAGEVVGLFHFRRIDKDTGLVTLVAVDPLYNGSELIPPLMFDAFSVCREIGIQRLVAQVSGNNTDALNLAISLNFRIIGAADTWHWYLPGT